MLTSFITLAWRNIKRKKLNSIINLTGLAIACAFCILVYWYVRYEQSFDNFHTKGKQLFRLEIRDIFRADKPETPRGFLSFLRKEEDDKNLITTPVILAAALQRNFPEIESTVRIAISDAVVKANGQSFREKNNVAFTDAAFFKSFDFPFLHGSSSMALSGVNQVVISESAARKYFGQTNVVGSLLQLSNISDVPFIISGVAKDFPEHSSFRFDILLAREADTWYKDNEEHGLNSFSDLLILHLKPQTNIAAFNKKMDVFGKNYFQPTIDHWSSLPGKKINPENFHFILRPFSKAHFNSSEGWPHFTSLDKIYQLSGLCVMILFITIVNYILLTLTGTLSRSREVGIRKTIGAPRKQIVIQFYIETQLLCFLGVMAGFLLAWVSMPLFNALVVSGIKPAFSFADIVLLLLVLTAGSGLLAGLYPAFVMSGLKPLDMMRQFSYFRLNPYLSKGLVVVQFATCIILIISSLIMQRQLAYTNQKNLGFDKEQVIAIQSPYGFESSDKAFDLRSRLYQYASTEPSLENITSTFFPYKGFNTNIHVINDKQVLVADLGVDYRYFSFFRIPIVKGRSFSETIASDSATLQLLENERMNEGSAVWQSVVVNETLYKMLGRPPLNITNRPLGSRIIGVCKDYYADDLTKTILPAYHKIEKRAIGYFWIKIKANQNLPNAIEKLKTNWNRLTANQPFSYQFLDEAVAKSYDTYQRWMSTITIFCLIAVIIACLGLFGITGLTVAGRIKEIGVRKVLGASVASILQLLGSGFLKLLGVAFLLACPIAWYLMNKWLQNFAYRIDIGWVVFLLAGGLTAFVAIATISAQTIKAAMGNPVKSLRAE